MVVGQWRFRFRSWSSSLPAAAEIRAKIPSQSQLQIETCGWIHIGCITGLNRNRREYPKMLRIFEIFAVLALCLGGQIVLGEKAPPTPALPKPINVTRFVPSGQGRTIQIALAEEAPPTPTLPK